MKGELYIGLLPQEDFAVAQCGCALYRCGMDATDVEGAGLNTDPLYVMCPMHLAAEEPHTVYVLFRETNSGDAGGDSDGYIESVHTTEEGAKTALEIARRVAIEGGHTVWDDETEPSDWTADWRIETVQVLP